MHTHFVFIQMRCILDALAGVIHTLVASSPALRSKPEGSVSGLAVCLIGSLTNRLGAWGRKRMQKPKCYPNTEAIQIDILPIVTIKVINAIFPMHHISPAQILKKTFELQT